MKRWTKLLHVYGQPFEHGDAQIVGNREALEDLRDTINTAILTGQAKTGSDGQCLFASDGEGYDLRIVCGPDDWDAPFWRDEGNWPLYLERNREARRGISALMRWLEVCQQEGKPFPTSLAHLKANIDHSSLLQRLLDGKEALPQPPPLKDSYPDYEAVEGTDA